MLDTLKSSEIQYLIHKYKDKLNEDIPEEDKQRYLQRIAMLKRELSLSINDRTLQFTKSRNHTNLDIKSTAINFLDRLDIGNQFYRLEIETMVDSILPELNWKTNHGSYSNSLLAVSIVDELLNHYNINKDIYPILEADDLSIDKFFRLSISCHKWFEKNYWI